MPSQRRLIYFMTGSTRNNFHKTINNAPKFKHYTRMRIHQILTPMTKGKNKKNEIYNHHRLADFVFCSHHTHILYGEVLTF